MLGAWGLTHLLSKNKPRTFSTPRQISDLLKEKSLKVPMAKQGSEYAPIWNGKWDKFKKAFENKEPPKIWGLPPTWKLANNVLFIDNCQKFEKEKITTEADPKYEAIIDFCAEKE